MFSFKKSSYKNVFYEMFFFLSCRFICFDFLFAFFGVFFISIFR